MPRLMLEESALHPAIREKVAQLHADVIDQVVSAMAQEAVVVVGMAGNPFVGKARKALDDLGVSYRYLAFGSYLSQWRRRNALKMWSGWPTLPMVFVNGVLIGGADDLRLLIDKGEFPQVLKK